MTKKISVLAPTSLLLVLLVNSIASAEGQLLSRSQEEKVADKKFWIVNSIFIGSTILDVESTFYALDKCKTCREGNPIMRPFIEAGRPWSYAFFAVTDAGYVYCSYYFKKHDKYAWWLIPITGTVFHTVVGVRNIKIGLSF